MLMLSKKEADSLPSGQFNEEKFLKLFVIL